MEHAAVRDLEQIQEQDEGAHMPRALSLGLVGIGGACIAFAVLAMGGRKTGTTEKRSDPLGDLVANHGKPAVPAGASPLDGDPARSATRSTSSVAAFTQLSAKDVTFPSILSDDARPTTALAAVRVSPGGDRAARRSDSPSPLAPSAAAPPPPMDKLPVVTFAGGTPPVPHEERLVVRETHVEDAPPKAPSLPAQNVLEASPIVTRPRDALTKTASDSAQINSDPAASVAAGHDGGWQLQVSSFKTQAEAEQFAEQLRARGHKAYTTEAHVAGRGTWWRVRVGPFPSQHSAQAYRSVFEAKEHVVPFVVQPEKSGDKH